MYMGILALPIWPEAKFNFILNASYSEFFFHFLFPIVRYDDGVADDDAGYRTTKNEAAAQQIFFQDKLLHFLIFTKLIIGVPRPFKK